MGVLEYAYIPFLEDSIITQILQVVVLCEFNGLVGATRVTQKYGFFFFFFLLFRSAGDLTQGFT